MKKLRQTLMVLLTITAIISCTGCSGHDSNPANKRDTGVDKTNYKVTFIELGSVKCIPCKQMQPVMKSVEEKYGKQVKVVFYDVWTDAGAPYGKQYGIEAIPTQIFLDKDGKEYFRHEGFFPEEELIKVLNQKGVK
jgi:thioredoxin 1